MTKRPRSSRSSRSRVQRRSSQGAGSRRVDAKLSRLDGLFREIRDSFSLEIVGGVIFVCAGYLGLTLFSDHSVPWIVKMTGWTAPLTVLGLLLVGTVLMLDERAGYWSAEAIVGGELLLLALQAGAFVWSHPEPNWIPRMDGSDGGLVGWGLGNLLVASLGWWPAWTLLALLGLGGLVLLMRSTPLIYLGPLAQQVGPAAAALRTGFTQMTRNLHHVYLQLRHPQAAPWEETGSGQEPASEPPPASPLQATQPAPPERTGPDSQPVDPEHSAPPAASDPPAAEISHKPSTASRRARSRPSRQARTRPQRNPEELPPLDLLRADSGKYTNKDVEAMAQLIKRTLEDFNVPVDIVHVESGPTVTQYGVQPLYVERAGQRRKIRVSRIVNLADDLALALAAPAVRIEAPVPGRPYVGIEVPNPEKTLVSMRSILEDEKLRKGWDTLPLALGRDTSGTPVIVDLARAPHILIAGATGSGKSVCINSIVISLLMQYGPESLQLVMVDPKMVELPGYNGIPHLIGKVVTEMDQVVGALTWLLLQMDDRYQLFREAGARNLATYNQLASRRPDLEPLPNIVLVVDELADLMMTAPEEIERQLCRLAQMARATGIHLVLATQRPSTDVVTGLIKANFPTRIAFAVTSQVDSRVILDSPGAEKLLGQGDMLLMQPDRAKLVRVQGAFVSDPEIEKVVDFWKERARAEAGGPIAVEVPPWIGLLDRMDDEEELLQDAIDVLRGLETCSTSLLQRKLRVGYPKAARLMAQLEARGAVGADLGGGQGREVLVKNDTDPEEEEEQAEDPI